VRQRRRRLSRSAEFERVYRHGSSISSRHLVLYCFPRDRAGESGPPPRGIDEADSGPRLGVSVGRRVGSAVSRNLVKRLIREAFWSLDEVLRKDHDYVVVARAGSAGVAEREGLHGIRSELGELLGEMNRRHSERGDGGNS